MTGTGEHADDVGLANSEKTLRFVMTLIVTTLMVAVTAYVLSYAVLAPGATGPAHGLSSAAQHARS